MIACQHVVPASAVYSLLCPQGGFTASSILSQKRRLRRRETLSNQIRLQVQRYGTYHSWFTQCVLVLPSFSPSSISVTVSINNTNVCSALLWEIRSTLAHSERFTCAYARNNRKRACGYRDSGESVELGSVSAHSGCILLTAVQHGGCRERKP